MPIAGEDRFGLSVLATSRSLFQTQDFSLRIIGTWMDLSGRIMPTHSRVDSIIDAAIDGTMWITTITSFTCSQLGLNSKTVSQYKPAQWLCYC